MKNHHAQNHHEADFDVVSHQNILCQMIWSKFRISVINIVARQNL